MLLSIYNKELYSRYKSNSQRARVMPEAWYTNNMYCPCCLNKSLIKFPDNNKAADFYCVNCKNKFETKASSNKFSKRVVDGEYNTMIAALSSDNAPNFFLMQYSRDDWAIKNLHVVPNFFISSFMIEKRNELSSNARRKGWIGCNILINNIPDEGKIFVVKNEKEIDMNTVNKLYKKTIFLKSKDPKVRGWTLDVWRCIRDLDKQDFALADLYTFKDRLKELHPDNHHVDDKIRQQLQLLRDNGILKFNNRGNYSLIR